MTEFIDPSDDDMIEKARAAARQRDKDQRAAQEARDAPKTRPTKRWSVRNRNT